MRSYGQFCPISRASEILAERWTPIILRNLLYGCTTFSDLAAGAPGISRTLLSTRLRELERAGVIEIRPKPEGKGSTYELTPAGRALWGVLQTIGDWGAQWLELAPATASPDVVLWAWATAYLERDRLPVGRVLVRFEFPDQPPPRRRLWLLVDHREPEVCHKPPGFDEDLVVVVHNAETFAKWHLGLVEWNDALRAGAISVSGPPDLARSLPTWNRRRQRAGHTPGAEHVGQPPAAGNASLPAGADHASAPLAGETATSLLAPELVGPTPERQPALAAARGRAGLQIPGFAGRCLRPGDDGYEAARRVWNGAIDRRPAIIARCGGIDDVIAALRFARERDLVVTVRGGGHGVAGTAVCDDGLVIDLSRMKDVEVRPDARTARVGPGLLWGELDAATQAFGLATTGGVVGHTGVGGLTLGGGIGWLMRRFGLTVDNLLSADVVSADGGRLTASADSHPDLFWALRGGGGELGVVTAFTYRLHPVGPMMLAGPVLWALEDAPELLRGYADLTVDAPREVATLVTLRRVPPLRHLPVELHGRPVCVITMCYVGDPAAGERALAPLRALGRPLLDLVDVRAYTALQTLTDATVPHGWHYYWKTANVAGLDDALVDTLAEHTARSPWPWSYTVLFHLGGAIRDIDASATAYAQRDAAHSLNVNAVWRPGDTHGKAQVAWARDFVAATKQHQTGAYVNFLDRDDAHRLGEAFDEATQRRLAAVHDRYDPDGVFRRYRLPATHGGGAVSTGEGTGSADGAAGSADGRGARGRPEARPV